MFGSLSVVYLVLFLCNKGKMNVSLNKSKSFYMKKWDDEKGILCNPSKIIEL